MLKERLSGDELKVIGARHGLSHEGARLAIMRRTQQVVDEVEHDLEEARETGVCPTWVVPFDRVEELALMVDLVYLICTELTGRGVEAQLNYVTVPDTGLVLMLEPTG
jgi:hypothetical protein